ncbi:type II toxin-antitoxin system prevent-host-death family antitoxin [Streptomyces adelaidensis]|uniref:type II toxin-antitoxin system prevent-host-death family antitoxin n=1 Tax=Streptomyces adelaidensis TaxID=2796465 RepID=UPI001908EB4E|nr:type II toxin-antitoxin system prevent-host-death family antitoxin [Streptomyces adelaidensis]
MSTATQRTALYRLYDSSDALVYIGISTQPETRWTQHASDKPWWPLVARKEVEWHADREQAEIAERTAVRAEAPLYNTAGAERSLLASHFPIGATLTQSQARLRISDVLDATQFGGKEIAITRRGKVAGYVMSPEGYDAAVQALAEQAGVDEGLIDLPERPVSSEETTA